MAIGALAFQQQQRRRWISLCLLLFFFVHVDVARCFYLPGVAPQDFQLVYDRFLSLFVFLGFQLRSWIHFCLDLCQLDSFLYLGENRWDLCCAVDAMIKFSGFSMCNYCESLRFLLL